jgi:hypothetical protein
MNKDTLMARFNNLPLELKAKIMYGGSLTHPVAECISFFINEEIVPLECDIDNPTFIQHLINTGWLKQTATLWDFDEIIELILDHHIYDD